MQPHPRRDAVLFIQLVSQLGRIRLRRNDGNHTGPSFCSVFPDNPQQPCLFRLFHSAQEPFRKHQFMCKDTAFSLRKQPVQRGIEPGNPGQVQCPCLKPVRQEVRHFFCVADAAGPAGDQRFQFRRQILPDQETARALGAESIGRTPAVWAVSRINLIP